MKKLKFQSPTGMHDILFGDQKYFQKIYKVVEDTAKFYGFRKIDTPILEQEDLFFKGLGDTTDVVQKEMYSVKTKGEDSLVLRPEGTAPVVRAFIQHGMFNMPQPVKVWYWGPFFRAEKPQTGRYRQFWSFGFEVLGEQSSVADAQVIQIFYNILDELKFKNLIIEINSIGDNHCRPYYKKILTSYLRAKEPSLCATCKKRFRVNPLRVLDCKEEKCQPVKSQAPQTLDHLCEECHNHFKEVLEFLEEAGLPYRLNPFLVRGLDYYTKTVFEVLVDVKEVPKKESKKNLNQSNEGEGEGEGENESEGEGEGEGKGEGEENKALSLLGGGRYDSLIKLLGGVDAPAIGGGAGVERIMLEMKKSTVKFSEEQKPKIFLAQIGNLAKRKCLKLFEDFRKAKIYVAESFGKDSLKIQLGRANKLNVKYVLILGQKEALDEMIIIRDMDSGKQDTVRIDNVIADIKKRLAKEKD